MVTLGEPAALLLFGAGLYEFSAPGGLVWVGSETNLD